jgi:hypothetical protein
VPYKVWNEILYRQNSRLFIVKFLLLRYWCLCWYLPESTSRWNQERSELRWECTTDQKLSQCMGLLVRYHPATITVWPTQQDATFQGTQRITYTHDFTAMHVTLCRHMKRIGTTEQHRWQWTKFLNNMWKSLRDSSCFCKETRLPEGGGVSVYKEEWV